MKTTKQDSKLVQVAKVDLALACIVSTEQEADFFLRGLIGEKVKKTERAA